MKKIFISVGELSGDIHAGNLISALKQKNSDLKISAIGGDNMAGQGAELLFHIRETSFMGLEAALHLRTLNRIWKQTLEFIDREKLDLVIPVDYPGFNLRLAEACKKRGIPVIYYISPQVWAWHQSRVHKIREVTDEVLCILPFEEDWYKDHDVNARYVGHPLRDEIIKEKQAKVYHNFKPEGSGKLVSLFPGSRTQEVSRHLPLMLITMEMLKQEIPDMKIVVAVSPNLDISQFINLADYPDIQFVTSHNHALMDQSDCVIVSSGTASLEVAMFNTPMVIIYKTSALTYWFASKVVKLDHIGLPNLIAGKTGITELIQKDATVDLLYDEVKSILTNAEKKQEIQGFLNDINERLGSSGSSEKVAEIAMKYLGKEE